MRCFWLTVLSLTSASFVFGQLESDTLTIQSSRSIILQPDQIVFDVSVNSSADVTLEQVVVSLQGSGITAADLTGVFGTFEKLFNFPGTVPAGPDGLQWSFTLAVPFSKLKGTVASLTMLQASIAKNNGGGALTFSVQGSRVSSELTQAQSCSLKDLVADAQVQAQKLAGAAGLTAGPIVAISDGSSGGGAIGQLFDRQATLGSWVSVPAFTAYQQTISVSIPTPFNCFAQVKFKLLRYQ